MPISNPSAPGDVGEGHIDIVLPNHNAIGAGTWALQGNPNVLGAFYLRNSTSADLDNLTWKVFLAAGTYTARILALTASSAGIVKMDLDTVLKATWDLYSAGTVENVVFTETGIAVATSTLKDLRLRVDGKHASSTDYWANIIKLGLWRTA